MRRRRRASIVGVAAVVVALAAAAVTVGETTVAIDRVADDPDAARLVLGVPPDPGALTPSPSTVAPADRPAAAAPSTYLLVGSDARSGLAGARADVVMLTILPASTTAAPVLVSLPRDLWVEDLCHGGRQRLNAALNGCGSDVTGAQLLTLTVQEITGVPVDHYVEFDFAGFESVVESVGGLEICTDGPVRDRLAGLRLPGGCTEPTPDQALAWARARHLEQRVDGRWRPVPGENDLARNERQQQLLLQMAATLSEIRSPVRLRAAAEAVLSNVTLGERLSLDTLVAQAWRWRHVDPHDVERPAIPVTDLTTAGSAQVLLPPSDLQARFARILDRVGEAETR